MPASLGRLYVVGDSVKVGAEQQTVSGTQEGLQPEDGVKGRGAASGGRGQTDRQGERL